MNRKSIRVFKSLRARTRSHSRSRAQAGARTRTHAHAHAHAGVWAIALFQKIHNRFANGAIET